MSVLVIGGGLLGMLTARYLASDGVEVSLYEKGALGGESSWAGGGIISPLHPWRYDDAVSELARWGHLHYQAVAAELLETTGIDPQYLRSGLMMLGIEAEEQQAAMAWAQRFGYRMETLDADGVQRLEPRLGPDSAPAGGLWMPEIAQLRNPRLVKAVVKSLQGLGVGLHPHSEVESLVVESGRVSGVMVGGRKVSASQVVVAGGAWSGRLLRELGVTMAVEPVRGQMLLFAAEPGLLQHTVLSDSHYLIPRADGHILAGSTLEHVGFDKSTTEAARAELHRFAVDLLPQLAEFEVEKQWSGLRPGSPEGIPFIGQCTAVEGLYVNSGHYRNGVVTGLASARLLADILQQKAPLVDPSPYQLQRG